MECLSVPAVVIMKCSGFCLASDDPFVRTSYSCLFGCMSIDLETYSDVNITKCGAYKYAESDEFEVLLFGVSVDGGPVVVYDLACGDSIPDEILAALSDENVTK